MATIASRLAKGEIASISNNIKICPYGRLKGNGRNHWIWKRTHSGSANFLVPANGSASKRSTASDDDVDSGSGSAPTEVDHFSSLKRNLVVCEQS